MTSTKMKTKGPAQGQDWVKDRAGKTTVLTRRKNATPTADTTTVVVTPPPDGDHAPRAAFGTPPELPAPVTLADVCERWLLHMRELGKTAATVASYAGDLEIAKSFLGAGTEVATLTAEQIAAYDASDAATKTAKGRPKAMPTILKTRRALRLAITWAAATGLIASGPYPAAAAR